VTAQQEAMWYGIYAVILWVVVALLVLKDGVRLHVRRTASELREIC